MTDLMRAAVQQLLGACEQRLPLQGQAAIIDELNALRAALAEPVQDTAFDRWWDNALDGPTPVAPVSKETARWIWNAARAEPVQEPDLSRCPNCTGPADNGHDREVPPNPYVCTKCMAEPVAWRWGYRSVTTGEMDWRGYVEIPAHPNLRSPEIIMEPLYTAPPQRPAEPVTDKCICNHTPLTDDQLDDIAVAARRGNLYDLSIAIERALKIGGKE